MPVSLLKLSCDETYMKNILKLSTLALATFSLHSMEKSTRCLRRALSSKTVKSSLATPTLRPYSTKAQDQTFEESLAEVLARLDVQATLAKPEGRAEILAFLNEFAEDPISANKGFVYGKNSPTMPVIQARILNSAEKYYLPGQPQQLELWALTIRRSALVAKKRIEALSKLSKL